MAGGKWVNDEWVSGTPHPQNHVALGQVRQDGTWQDFARDTPELAIDWAKRRPQGTARVVDWIDRRTVLWPRDEDIVRQNANDYSTSVGYSGSVEALGVANAFFFGAMQQGSADPDKLIAAFRSGLEWNEGRTVDLPPLNVGAFKYQAHVTPTGSRMVRAAIREMTLVSIHNNLAAGRLPMPMHDDDAETVELYRTEIEQWRKDHPGEELR